MGDSEDLHNYVSITVVPAWLYGMPDDWYDAVLDALDRCAISLKWGHD